jgi:hypothetical protein
MDTVNIINIVIGVLGLLIGATAHVRINRRDKTNIADQKQSISGDNNKQAGRDVIS